MSIRVEQIVALILKPRNEFLKIVEISQLLALAKFFVLITCPVLSLCQATKGIMIRVSSRQLLGALIIICSVDKSRERPVQNLSLRLATKELFTVNLWYNQECVCSRLTVICK